MTTTPEEAARRIVEGGEVSRHTAKLVARAYLDLIAERETGREVAGALLTADEVMAEAEPLSSPVVAKVLRRAYDGHDRKDDKDKIQAVVLRDLSLKPVVLYQRILPQHEAPAHVRRASKPRPQREGEE